MLKYSRHKSQRAQYVQGLSLRGIVQGLSLC